MLNEGVVRQVAYLLEGVDLNPWTAKRAVTFSTALKSALVRPSTVECLLGAECAAHKQSCFLYS